MIWRNALPAFLALLCVLPASAEEDDAQDKPEEQKTRIARFLPVGDAPPFRQVVRDGVRYELEPPPGTIPPRDLVAVPGGDPADPLRLRLGMLSKPVSVPEGPGPLTLSLPGEEGEDGDRWLSVKRPETGDFLVLLWRDPAKKTWDHVSHLIVPDGPQGAPPGTVRIANLFPQDVRIEWAGEPVVLKAGTTLRREVKPGDPVLLRILVPDSSGKLRRYYSGEVMQNQGERGFVVIYRADGMAPRRPLKVAVYREPAPLPPPPDKS